MSRTKYLVVGIVCFVLGSMLLQPAFGHMISSKDAHTLSSHHLSYFASVSWANNRFYAKTTSDSRFVNTSGNEIMSGQLTANNFAYSSAKTRYLTVSGPAFRPSGDFQVGGIGEIYGISGNFPREAQAPVYLPDGATITALKIYYQGTTDTDLAVQLSGYPGYDDYFMITTDGAQMFPDTWVRSSGNDAGVRTTDGGIDPAYATIDNETNGYLLRVEFGENSINQRLWKVKITYTVPNPE